MPTTLTDSSSFDDATAPVGTDIRNASGVRGLLQTLANRTRFLYDRLTALADIAALKAIASPADTTQRFVKATGLYLFDGASSASEVLPFIVAPTTGTGRWFLQLAAVDTATGFQKFAPTKTRTVSVPLVHCGTTTTAVAPGSENPGAVFGSADARFSCFGYSTSCAHTNSGSSAHYGVLIDLTQHMHDGATLTSATIRLGSTTGHGSNLPTVFPSFGIWRRRHSDGAMDKLIASPASGHVTDAPADVASYDAPHDLVFTPTQNNVVDRANYSYFAGLYDEGGTHAVDFGVEFYGLKLVFSSIADMRFP